MRIAVLWTELPGYLAACLRFLQEHYDVELMVIRNLANRPDSTRRFFDESLFSWIPAFHTVKHPDFLARLDQIRDLVWQFEPDAILLAFQWRYLENYSLVKEAKRRGVLVIGGMDNPWRDMLKQHMMVLASRLFSVLPLDAVWVPGEHAAEYAKRLFGTRIPIWRGLYTADTTLFCIHQSNNIDRDHCKSFLYVGRFSPEKGIIDLIEAYRQYRLRAGKDYWHLKLVGDGPLRSKLTNIEIEGVEIAGFKQPVEIKELMKTSGVFVLPSHYEPWGVVVHEAISLGLPVLCSDRCGASVELVQHGFNGLNYRAGEINQLSDYMFEISRGDYDLERMSQNSIFLSQRYSTALWADTLMRGIQRLATSRAIARKR